MLVKFGKESKKENRRISEEMMVRLIKRMKMKKL